MMRRSNKSNSVLSFLRARRRYFYILLPIILIAAYLNTANNHFYHRLHSAGLVWPQNDTVYTIGAKDGQRRTYVALGDSLTAGVGAAGFSQTYTYAVASHITPPGQSIDLIPLATPGYKSIDLINHYLTEAIELKPDIVTILIGVNDVHGIGPSPVEFRNNYETLIRRLRSETKAEIYAISIPSIGTNSLVWPPYNNYYSVRTQSFNRMILSLTKQYGINYVDLYSETLRYASPTSNYYSKDDFHPSADGYAIWAEIIARDINK